MAAPQKASQRIAINRSLLGVIITAFFLTINLKKEILFENVLTLQLVLAIPLFLFSMFAYSKMAYRKEIKRWNFFAFSTFIMAYSFVLNITGILIGKFINVNIALIFFGFTWILALTYSFIDISYDKSVIKERIVKDSILISLQFVFGVLIVLGILNF